MLQMQSIHTLTLHGFVKRTALITLPKWGGSLMFENGNTEYYVTALRNVLQGRYTFHTKLKLTTEEIQYLLQAICHISPVFLPYHWTLTVAVAFASLLRRTERRHSRRLRYIWNVTVFFCSSRSFRYVDW